jgi:hypothetical protein
MRHVAGLSIDELQRMAGWTEPSTGQQTMTESLFQIP